MAHLRLQLGASSNILYDASRLKDSDQGFSFVESLIAIVILGIIMAAGLAFYYQANALYYRSLHYQMATWVADSRMEQIKNLGCSAVSNGFLGTDTSTGTAVSLTGNSADTSHLMGLRKVTLPTCSTTNPNDVVVSVIWTEPCELANSNKHKVSLETYVGP